MKPRYYFLLLGAALLAVAATVKISDLPLATSHSTNTFMELADMNAATKSVKYLMTNLVNRNYFDVGTNNAVKMATNEAKAYFDAHTGLVSNNVASAGLLAVDATKTNGIAATSAMVSALQTNVTLASLGVNTNDFVLKAGDTMTGTLGFSGTATLLNLPSLTTAQKNAATPQAGSLVYDSDLARVQAYDGAAWHSRMRLDGDTSTVGAAFTLGSVILTNNPITTVSLQINATNGTTTNIFEANSGGTNRWKIDSSGNLLAGVDAKYNVGATGATRPKNVDISGTLTYDGNVEPGASGTGYVKAYPLTGGGFVLGSRGRMLANAGDGLWNLQDGAGTGFTGLVLGPNTATAPSAYISGANGLGTDKVGGTLTSRGGYSTGTGAPGAVDVATSLSDESSGSTANAYSIRYHAKGKFVALTHATTNAIIKFSLPANKLRGGSITALCYATNSTPHLQALTSEIQFAAVAVGTTITGTISQVDNPLAADSGTLTCAYTLVDNGDNTFYISANPNSSLSSPTERCKIVITGMSGNAATTITDY